MTRRVVVTGMGMVTPLGHTVEQTWEALLAGRSGIGPVTRYDATGHQVRIAAEVQDWDMSPYLTAKDQRRHDRYQWYAYAAAHQAIAQAGLALTDESRHRASVIIGSAVGGLESFQEQLLLVEHTGDLRKVTPFGIPMLVVNGASNMVSISLGAMGPSYTPASACATGADCIGHAFDLIRTGRIDCAVAGAGEAPILPIGLGAFDRIQATSRRNDDPQGAVRPFAKDRDGLVFGEGAGVIVLESLESAAARGADVLAELVGYGSTSDAFHMTAPRPEGLGAALAIQQALAHAQVNVDEVQYINAHGTATQLNDVMETRAVKHVFGEHAYRIPMSSTKSMTGHAMGMTAAIEAIFCVLALRDQIAPPTLNLYEPDPECDLDYVPLTAREVPMTCAMTNSFGFGGHNASLIFRTLK